MLIALMVIFGVCWLPYHAYFLALYYVPTLGGIYGIQGRNMLINSLSFYLMCSKCTERFLYVSTQEVPMFPCLSLQHVFLAFYWLAMSHAIVNPVVYFLMNPT